MSNQPNEQSTQQTDDVLVLKSQNAELQRRVAKLSKDLEESRAAHRGTQEEHGQTITAANALIAAIKGDDKASSPIKASAEALAKVLDIHAGG